MENRIEAGKIVFLNYRCRNRKLPPMPKLIQTKSFLSLLRVALTLLAGVSGGLGASAQLAHFVDPFLGAGGGGNVFPGPALPFGMIKPGPDMTLPGVYDLNSGWDANGEIRGFSQTHVSGSGGGAKYGNIVVMPTTGGIALGQAHSPRAEERASAGYYSVHLTRYNVGVEIAAARRAAIYRFTYPDRQQANVLIDVSRCLLSDPRHGESQAVTASEVQVLSPTEVAGSSSVTGGWNKQTNSYTVYFDAQFDTGMQTHGTWIGDQPRSDANSIQGGEGQSAGAWVTFVPPTSHRVLMKIGISFVSVEQARKNAETEIPGFDFEAVRSRAVEAWDQALSKIDLKGETAEQATEFYTALYHTMLMPTDRTGENPLWQSNEPYYDDYYTIWDIFRTEGPLLTLIAPERESAMVRSLVDIYRHEGWLPDARSGNFNGRTQGGSDAEFLITDAYLKHLKGIDWETALQAEIHDAEVSPPDHFKEGRGGLDDWRDRGYVSIEGSDRSGSVTMEYAADDFEIALLARGMGRKSEYTKYLARSENWRNLWDSDFVDGGFKGFIHPRHRDGSWLSPFTALDSCSWNGNTFYEGNSWTYSFFVPQDIAGLIEKAGGAETFVERLDSFFSVSGRYDVGNEPGFLIPYLYNWAGRPDKTAARLRSIVAASFHSGPDGLPGNDDSGAMSSWFVFAQLGIFPAAGQNLYLIASPAYAEARIHTNGGKIFVIEGRNVSPANLYVTAATLNGKPFDRAWLRHEEITAGGRLVLTMGNKASGWGQETLPPPATD